MGKNDKKGRDGYRKNAVNSVTDWIVKSKNSYNLLESQASFIRKQVDPETAKYFSEIANLFESHGVDVYAREEIESDIFIPTYDGNMARAVQGHRRYLGLKQTILLNRMLSVDLIDQYESSVLSWNEFSDALKESHGNRKGQPTKRLVIPDRPKEEDYFYAKPEECLRQSYGQLSST